MEAETILFEKYLKKFRKYLKVTRLCIDEDDIKRSFKERLKQRWFFTINFFFYNVEVFFEIVWFVNGILIGRTLNELTYVFPCFTVCWLSNLKMVYFLFYAHHVVDIIMTLRKLQADNQRDTSNEEDVRDKNKRIEFLNSAIKYLGVINFFAPISFGLCTLASMLIIYLDTHEIQLMLPFYILYPFNAYDMRVYPLIFTHQLWCGFFAVFGVLGPDCFFYTSATFIHIQLCSLQCDMTGIQLNELLDYDLWRNRLILVVERHKQLIRCIDMLETIYSKSTLFNVVTSSFMLCLAGFNIIAGKDIIAIMSFTVFFVMGFVQIFLFCYYGDLLSASTAKCSDAIYNSEWYMANVATKKDLLFILARSQKPSKLTANGFLDINLRAFGRILSASWSYFALLSTMYRDQGA